LIEQTGNNRKSTPQAKSFLAAQKTSYLYPIITAMIIPLVIGLYKPGLLSFFRLLPFIIALFLPIYITIKVLYDWLRNERGLLTGLLFYLRPIPPGFVYGTDLKFKSLPWVTAFIIIVNIFIYYNTPSDIVRMFTFFPRGEPSIFHILVSVFTSAFLHGNPSHLWGNMIFFWAFGSTLEPRIGSIKYLLSYFICIIFSKIIVFSLLLLKSYNSGSLDSILDFHSLGASGAIAGIMGLFVVRCYFSRITMSLPFFFLPFVSIPLKIQSTLLISLYFAMDVAGSVKIFENDFIRINYWAHFGGYIGGFLLGYVMKLNIDASKEAVRVKAEKISKNLHSNKDASLIYKEILQEEPENETALRHFLKIHKYDDDRLKTYYIHLIEVLTKKNFTKAVELFNEYYPKFLNELPGNVLLRFGIHFYRNYELNKAKPCLEIAGNLEGPWQEI